ncbi:MAG: NAD(P)/FAD-dependent oxidoreductase [Clostridia bacterium]|nr:NAD(P)/FAD-dependent oxidoreductase [Clostridia bacterium]
MKHYDAVVIGSGVGGLAAGAVLAKNGLNVAVLEKNHCPGGVANSFRRGRFEFEISLHELCGFGPPENPVGSSRRVLDALGLSDRIEWARVPEAYRLITFAEDSPIDAVMPFGTRAFADALESYAPGSRGPAEKAFALAGEIRRALSDLGRASGPEEKRACLLSHPDFLRAAGLSVDEGLRQLGMPERGADIMKGYWAYLFTDCSELSFLHYLNMVNSYIELGSVIPKNRSLELTNAFAGYIRERGGDVLTDSEVTRIMCEGGAVRGVRTRSGAEYAADGVVCNISPLSVYSLLLEEGDVTAFDRKKTNARELSGRGFCVYLGLDRSARELGLENYSYFIYPDMDTASQYRSAGSTATNLIQNTVCQNAADEEASPPGTCILTMTTLFSSDVWGGVAPEDYHAEKDAFAARMISVFEKATGISISHHIEEMEVAAPQTFARYIGSPEGAIYGYKAASWDSILARKLMDGKDSDIRGLYFAGGFGMNLNGYSSAMSSGMDAAERLLGRRDAR